MKPLLINSFDNQGGAAIATYRLHCGLRSIGIDSKLLVQNKKSDDKSVIGSLTKQQKIIAVLRPYIDRFPATRYRNREQVLFSSAWLPERLASKVENINPDLIHLFWVNGGMLRIETLKKFKQPIIWTLHDMWPFTGGCHYDDECGKFRQACGNCPVLHSDNGLDLSQRVLARKLKSWGSLPIVVVATSNWLADMAKSSSLFKNQRIEVIPNGIDTERYKPLDKHIAREAYNLPQDKNLILFSAFNATSDKRKGNQFLLSALAKLSQLGWGADTELVIIGASKPESAPELGMTVHYMGQMFDEISQVLLYSAADVVVAPSMQENLSNTVMESLSCGTPVVAFHIGGMPDMIEHQINGYLAKPFEANDLAEGIMWVLGNSDRTHLLSKQARQSVLERYALDVIASNYLSLYQSVIG